HPPIKTTSPPPPVRRPHAADANSSPAPPPPTQEIGSSPFSDVFDDLDADKDQETLIRRMPEGWDEESPSSPPEAAPPPAPPPQPDPEPRSVAPELAPKRPAKQSSGNTGQTSSVRRHVVQSGVRALEGPQGPVIGGAILLLSVLFGVGLGLTLMTLVLVVSGYQLVDNTEPVLDPPRITVVGPPQAVVRVDGERVGPNVQVSHGKRHAIDVRLGGRVVFAEELVLNRGEHRVVVLSVAGEERP
ncbi:MAG: hypothetical protein AAF211_20570, partial [Myxococcota bacterium]